VAAAPVWEGQGSQIALLFTETRLPGEISGRELAEKLCGAKPALKVIYTSVDEAANEGAGMIGKPYAPEQLFGVVQNALAKKG
jgi:FixJ family two-component response regulator